MIPDIKIARAWFTGTQDALVWSDEGIIASPSRESISLFIPSVKSHSVKLVETTTRYADDFYEVLTTPALSNDYIFEQDIFVFDDVDFSIEFYTRELAAVNLAWSPLGAAQNRGCILAVLTSRGEVYFYESTGNLKVSKWELTLDVLKMLCQDEHLGRPKNGTEIPTYLINSLAWSPQLPAKASKWGRTYLAIGTKSGAVRILEILNGSDIILKATIQINDKWITDLKWSQIYKSTTGELITVLICKSSDNSVVAIPISYDYSTEELVTNYSATVIHAPSRFHVQAKDIYYHKPTSTLAYVFSAGLSINTVAINLKSISNLNNLLPHITKASLAKLAQPIHTLTVLEKSETELHIAGFSDYRNALLLVATIDEASISLAVAENNTLQRFIDDRVAAGEFLGSNYTQDAMSDRRYTSQCFGVTVSPLGDYIAFLHSVIPDAQLRYPIPSSLRARISFLVLGGSSTTNSADANTPRLQPEHIAVVPPATQYSPIVTWWKVQAIIGSLRQKLRPAFIEATTKLFHDRGNIPTEQQLLFSADKDITGDVDSSISQLTLVQTVGFDMFLAAPALDSFRVYHHYKPQAASYPRAFIERLAYSVLAFLAAADDEVYGGKLVGLDKALVLAYAQVLVSSPRHRESDKVQSVVARVFTKYALLASESEPLESVPVESTTLAVRGEGFEETFNFFKGASEYGRNAREANNGYRDEANPDLYAIKSEGRGHSWRICATTLLPLLRYDGKTCTGCSRPQITRDESDPAYDGIILKSVLEAIDICIYCGCKFVNN